MSISTRTGDNGSTSLIYGKKVSKSHPQVEAYGAIDELTSHLGLARASSKKKWIKSEILTTQKELIPLMGELAVPQKDLARFQKSKFPKLEDGMLERLDQTIERLEAKKIAFSGWALPGDSFPAAALDLARTACRRAERLVINLDSKKTPIRSLIKRYLNRLSDYLWLLARFEEK